MRIWLIGGSINGILGVLSGLIAGHAGLPAMIANDGIVRMGEHYQFWHASVLLALAALPTPVMTGWMRRGGILLLIGATAFGLSVQIATLADFAGLLFVAWVSVAFLVLGWISLLIGALKLGA